MKISKVASSAIAAALLASACAGGDSVATGAPTPVATTAPILLPADAGPSSQVGVVATTPPVLASADASLATPLATPTSVQILEPTPAPTAVPPTAVPATAVPPTAVPATAVPVADPTSVVTTEADSSDVASEAEGDVEPTVEPTPEPTPKPARTGTTIGLVNIPVVNLLSGETITLDSVSPKGPALLFFWAPH